MEAAWALGKIAEKKPKLFGEVYLVIRSLMEEGKTDLAQTAADNQISQLSASAIKSVNLAYRKKDMQGKDWPIILSDGMPDDLVLLEGEKLEAVLLAKEVEEENQIAMKVKQARYRSRVLEKKGKELREHEIPLTGQANYLGRYKLPWEDFCEFMDEHYEAFHQDPTSFIPDDQEILKAPLGDLSGIDFSDIPGSDGEEAGSRVVKAMSTPEEVSRLEAVLLKVGLDSEAYGAAAEALSEIAQNKPGLSERALSALEAVLLREGLDSEAYGAAALALGNIAQNEPKLLRESSVSAVEAVLHKEVLGWAYQAAAWALSYIAQNEPELRERALSALEALLHKEGLDSGAYVAAAGALGYIALNKPELLRESSVSVLEWVLQREGVDYWVYRRAAVALGNIAQCPRCCTIRIRIQPHFAQHRLQGGDTAFS